MAEINSDEFLDPKVVKQVDSLNKELKETQKELQDVKKAAKEVGGQLRTAASIDKLKEQIEKLQAADKKLTEENKKLKQSILDVNKQLTDYSSKAKKAETSTNQMAAGLKKAGAAFLAFFAFDKIKGFIGDVITVTSEFQKFSAVLTNTLGSRSAANKALTDIKDFAAKTPFSVQELTASFVKLANQGFRPTTEQLRQLGDLASSTGKGFDQLTEAIIDAQTGQFERLKEFGIRASKEGDKVTFTFKGVQTQTDFTSESIQKYILSLGDLQGVTGSMAAISKTLGGQISNLGDSWDTFLATLGEGNNGALSGTVSLLSKALNIATDLVKTYEQQTKENSEALAGAALERYKAFTSEKEQIEFKQKLYEKILDLQIQIARADNFRRTGGYKNKAQTGDDLKNYFNNKEQLAALQLTIAQIKDINDDKLRINKEGDEKEKQRALLALAEKMKALQKLYHDKAKEYLKDNEELELQPFNPFPSDSFLEEQRSNLDALGQEILNDLKTQADAEHQIEVDKNEKDLEDYREKQQQKRDIASAFYDSIQTLSSLYFSEQQNNLSVEQQNLRLAREQELKQAGDNKDAQKKINDKYDKEDRAIKIKQAKREKEAAMVSIVLSTARGVMAALASVPPNVPLSLIIGGTGLVQLGVASHSKLPAFWKGTKSAPGGLVHLGEKGFEQVVQPDGKSWLTPNEDTIMEVPRGSEIKTHEETLRDIALKSLNSGGTLGTKRDLETGKQTRLLKQIVSKLDNKKSLEINFSRSGIELLIKSAARKTKLLDEFYRIKI